MSTFRKIEHIKAQIIETEKMLEIVGDHPIMSFGFREKLTQLKEELSKYSKEVLEPSITLLFSGNAVKGSIGIKSNFVSATIKPFQDLIKTQTSLVRFGQVAKRGQSKGLANTELFLTALPTGSFGVELSQLDSNDLFNEHDVANAMKQVIRLIEATSLGDEEFEKAIEETPKRNLPNLKKFLKAIDKEDSFLRLESGKVGIEISEASIHLAYDRVDKTNDLEEEIIILGTIRGFLLDSGKFEISNRIDGKTISGFISADLSEEEVIKYDKEFLNKLCKIHLKKHSTHFKTGREKHSYEFLGIEEIKDASR